MPLRVDPISVEPNWRNRGVGRHWMGAVVDDARAAYIAELEAERGRSLSYSYRLTTGK